MRFRRRKRRVFYEGPEDDGMVLIRGHLVPPEWAEWNAQEHMRGFDSLPVSLRDEINYAQTPETGALPTPKLIEGRMSEARQKAEAIARFLTTRK